MRALAAALALLAPAPAGADAAARLAEAVSGLERAETAPDRLRALGEAIGAYEEALAGLRASLRAAVLREAEIARRFDAEGARVAQLLGVLAAVERSDGPLLLLHPAGPLGTVRSGIVAADLAPALQAEAAALRRDLEALSAIRVERAAALAVLEAGLVRAQEARTALAQAAAARGPAPQSAEAAALLEDLAAGVRSLDALAAGIAALPGPDDPVGLDFAEARGWLPWPVRVATIRAPGARRPGVELAAPPAALVTAPWPATVRYSGPLLDDAIVMILEPEAGYLIVLSGLAVAYVEAGAVVEAGAALGLLGGREPAAGEFVAAAREGGVEMRETLYVELRHGEIAVDPTEWFTSEQE
jgi:septal ring factor EnvC (AmiA/AmiB activator)